MVKAEVKAKNVGFSGLTLRDGHWERMVIKECMKMDL